MIDDCCGCIRKTLDQPEKYKRDRSAIWRNLGRRLSTAGAQVSMELGKSPKESIPEGLGYTMARRLLTYAAKGIKQ